MEKLDLARFLTAAAAITKIESRSKIKETNQEIIIFCFKICSYQMFNLIIRLRQFVLYMLSLTVIYHKIYKMKLKIDILIISLRLRLDAFSRVTLKINDQDFHFTVLFYKQHGILESKIIYSKSSLYD